MAPKVGFDHALVAMRGDIAVLATMSDLTNKGYVVYAPVANNTMPFDLIAYKDRTAFRIQCKYSEKGHARRERYKKGDFDYYAVYLPKIKKVVYPSIDFAGITIRSSIPNTAMEFFWYEDFLEFTDTLPKLRSYIDFGLVLLTTGNSGKTGRKFNVGKPLLPKPSKEELAKLINEVPINWLAVRYGITVYILTRWLQEYDLERPPNGYWNKGNKPDPKDRPANMPDKKLQYQSYQEPKRRDKNRWEK